MRVAYHRLFADGVETVDVDAQFNLSRLICVHNKQRHQRRQIFNAFVPISNPPIVTITKERLSLWHKD